MNWYAVSIQGCDDSTKYISAMSLHEAMSWVEDSHRFSKYGCKPTVICTQVEDMKYGDDYDECLLDYVEAMLSAYATENPAGP